MRNYHVLIPLLEPNSRERGDQGGLLRMSAVGSPLSTEGSAVNPAQDLFWFYHSTRQARAGICSTGIKSRCCTLKGIDSPAF